MRFNGLLLPGTKSLQSAVWCTAALCSQHYLICLLAPEQIVSQGMGRKQMTANSSVQTELCWAQPGWADLRAGSSHRQWSEDAGMLQWGITLCLEHLPLCISAFHLPKSFLTLYNYKTHSSNIVSAYAISIKKYSSPCEANGVIQCNTKVKKQKTQITKRTSTWGVLHRPSAHSNSTATSQLVKCKVKHPESQQVSLGELI